MAKKINKIKINKKERAEEIDFKIIEILKNEGKPVSTRDLSLRAKYSWHTILNHCLRMQMAGKISGYKLANLNVWFIVAEVGK